MDPDFNTLFLMTRLGVDGPTSALQALLGVFLWHVKDASAELYMQSF